MYLTLHGGDSAGQQFVVGQLGHHRDCVRAGVRPVHGGSAGAEARNGGSGCGGAGAVQAAVAGAAGGGCAGVMHACRLRHALFRRRGGGGGGAEGGAGAPRTCTGTLHRSSPLQVVQLNDPIGSGEWGWFDSRHVNALGLDERRHNTYSRNT